MTRILCAALASLISMTSICQAAVTTQKLEYTAPDGTVMVGTLAYDDKLTKAVPAILIVPDWMGPGAFSDAKAVQLAGEGYVAFAADIYGKGNTPKNQDEAKVLATKYKSDRPLLRQHIIAAYDKLKSLTIVNGNKILVMGYCFGGTTALELARSGAKLTGVASFHGGLSNPAPQDAKNIKEPVLVMHGADDPNVPPAEVAAFRKEMTDARVKLRFVAYKGAVHAFTNPEAGNDNSKGVAYNEKADKASWAEFEKFLKSVM